MFDFGKRLRSLRKRKGITQKQLSNAIGVTERAIVAYESGKMKPNFDTINSLADTFAVSADYLLGRTDTPNVTSEVAPVDYSTLEEIRKSIYEEVDKKITEKFFSMWKNAAVS